jgi:hypothetical protein
VESDWLPQAPAFDSICGEAGAGQSGLKLYWYYIISHPISEALMSIRPVKSITQSRPAMEGAGVRLHRAFGFGDTSAFDPFLMMDDFRGDRPSDYMAGFPWHPHRGIETITYVLAGTVDHAEWCGWCAATSGARPGRCRASPPIRAISMSRCRPASARP